jgi:Recombination enhancement, RecA-dependent nuclease
MLTQRTPMNRGKGFARRVWTPAPVPPARPLLRPVVYARFDTPLLPVTKEVKARPGKKAPTVLERAWMDSIVRYGCVACRKDGLGYVAPQVHHILSGGRRIGHLSTLPLCPGHHQDGHGALGMVARHPYKARFEAKYGTEAELLALLQRHIGATP